MGIPDHLTCLLRNLYAGQEATVRNRYRIIYVKVTTDWFKIGKIVCQGCILSSCLFNLKSEHIIWNARLDKSQCQENQECQENLRYADDTTLMAESKEELKSLLTRVKEEWKSWLKTQYSKNEDGGFPDGSVVKNLSANAGDTGSIPDLGRSHMLLSLCSRAREPKLQEKPLQWKPAHYN